MNIHLYTTDISAFRLLHALPKKEQIKVTAIIIPENRTSTKKVIELISGIQDIPIYIQTKKGWSLDGIPDADIAISWLYSQFIPSNILDTYAYGILNMHGGKIPQYRGANVLQWAIINGENELGITWHTMVYEIDAGPIWAESSIPVSHKDNALDLRKSLIKEGIRTFPEAWGNCINPIKVGKMPDLTKGRYWRPRKPEDGRIFPGMTIKQVKDMIRALPKPWPGPTIKVNSSWKEIKYASMLPVDGSVSYETVGGVIIYLVLTDHDTVRGKYRIQDINA